MRHIILTTERERERGTNRQTDTDRERHRQTDQHTHTHTHTHTLYPPSRDSFICRMIELGKGVGEGGGDASGHRQVQQDCLT